MNNIGFIITKSQIGGAQKFVLDQIHLLKDNYNVTLITNEVGWLTDETKNFGVKILVDKRIEHLSSIFYLFRLVFFLKKNTISLLICNSANAGIYGRLAAFLSKNKSIYISHGWSSNYNGGKFSKIFNKIEYCLSLFTNKIICVSKQDFMIAITKIKIDPNKLIWINNSIIPNISAQLPKPDNPDINLLTVCRLEHPKRVDLIIQAIKNKPNICLNVVGDGNQYESLVKLVKIEQISNVKFLGEILPFNNFSAYDIFILISESEGLPISVLEAMSNKLPVILSNVGGCPELINNNGVLVENNAGSILKGINLVISKIEMFSEGSLAFFQSEFNLKNNINKYSKLYDEIFKN